jgi:DNA-binding transcriptional ArsR family regulator
MAMMSHVFASPNHLAVFRALARSDSWSSITQMMEKAKVSKRTVYRVVRDLRSARILDAQFVSTKTMYRITENARWIDSVLEEPKILLTIRNIPGRDHLKELISQDRLMRRIIDSLLQAPTALTLRQVSAEVAAWAIEVKARLNMLMEEGLVFKRDLGYTLNRRIASELVREL